MLETFENNNSFCQDSCQVAPETLDFSSIKESVGGSHTACVLEGEWQIPVDNVGEHVRESDLRGVSRSNVDSSAPVLGDSEMREAPPLGGSINEGGLEGGPNLHERGGRAALTCPLQRIDQTPQGSVGTVERREVAPQCLKLRSPGDQQDLRRSVATSVVAGSPPGVQCSSIESQETDCPEAHARSAVRPCHNTCQEGAANGERRRCLNSVPSQSHESVVTEGSDRQTSHSTAAGSVPLATDAALTQEGETSETARCTGHPFPASVELNTPASDDTVVQTSEGLYWGQGCSSGTRIREATAVPSPERREPRLVDATAQLSCLPERLVEPDDDAVTSCKDLLAVVVDCGDATDESVSDGPSSDPVKNGGDKHSEAKGPIAPGWLWNHARPNEEDTSSEEHLPVTRSRLRWESRDLFGSKERSLCSTMALVKPFLFAWAPTQRLDWEESDLSDAGKEPSAARRRAITHRMHAGRLKSKPAVFPLKRSGGSVNRDALRKQRNNVSSNFSSVSVESCCGAKVRIRKRKASFTKSRTEGSYTGHHGKPVDDDTTVTQMSLSLAAQLYPAQLLQFFVERELRGTQTQERQPGATPSGPTYMESTAESRMKETERCMKECSCPCQGTCGGASHRNFSDQASSSSTSLFSGFTAQRGQACSWRCSCSQTGRHSVSSPVYHNHYAGASFYLLVSDIKSASPEALGTLLSTSAQPIHLGPNRMSCGAPSERR